MAEIKRFVNRASSAGGDGTTNNTTGADRAYYTLNEWEAAEQTDLVTDTDTHQVDCTGTLSTQDTTSLNVDGWTTGASNDITIDGLNAFNGYKLEGFANSDGFVTCTEDYANFFKLNVEVTSNAAGNRGIRISGVGGTTLTKLVIFGCNVRNSGGGATPAAGIQAIALKQSANNYVINNFIYGDWANGIVGGYIQSTASCIVYNNTVIDCYDVNIDVAGQAGANARCINNIAQGAGTNDYEYNSGYTFGGNISEDATSPDVALRNITLTLTSATDLHLDSTDTEAMGAGVNLYTDADYPVTIDIDGDARDDAAFDIGADHYVSAGGDPVPPLRRRLMMRQAA